MIRRLLFPILFILLMGSCTEEKKATVDELVSFDKVWTHLEKLDQIAKENGSNRAVGTPGGIASREYIAEVLSSLGLTPVYQDFENHNGAEGCNLIVDIKGKAENEIVMIGSHYDSVEFGPGINDNGSGVAAVLEIISAIQNNKIVPEKTLRFGFWDSEETGVEGSPAYYKSLGDDAKQIIAYLNVDMIASKGGEIMISDTDGSTMGELMDGYKEAGIDSDMMTILGEMFASIKFAEGSVKLEEMAKEIFGELGMIVKEDLQFARNSDTYPFMENIPTLGIMATKTISEPTDDGGEMVLFAPCYHQACDDINNIDKDILQSCLKAVSIMIQRLAIEPTTHKP